MEDNSTDADLIIRHLTRSGMIFSYEIVETRAMYEQSLATFRPDIILSDYSLPSFDAINAFNILKNSDASIPFILVSGTIGEENAVMLIKDGVTDFASKDNLVGLSQKVLRALKEAEESLEKAAILEKLKIQTAALLVANKELVLQNAEKEKKTIELLNANKELLAFNFISSHDLQEPLRKIQTFASIIMEEEMQNMTDVGKKAIDRILSSATRMRRLIEDLLAFSRVSSVERQYEMTDLKPILADVMSELRDLIKEKSATIEAHNLLPINIVAFQFRQLLCNLISNSLKFALPDTAPSIKINTTLLQRGDSKLDVPGISHGQYYWNLTFEDNGIGFGSEFNESIFVMFKRLHHVQEYSGTGIGLAIVKKIVDNHNGIIVADGQQHKGAIFNIYIPIQDHDDIRDKELPTLNVIEPFE